MANYDKVDPECYDTMYYTIPREIYMREHWRPLIEKKIESYCAQKNVLELGCGTGIYTEMINKYTNKVLGTDISGKMLIYTKNKKGLSNLIRIDAHKIPLRTRSFDVIITMGLFEYIQRDVVITEMKRILKQNGICILSVPNKYSACRIFGKLSKIFGKKPNQDDPSKIEMLKLFSESGFELIEYKIDDGLIWLPDTLDRLIGKRLYNLIETVFKIFGENPFSNVMLFVIRKNE
ncbi:MAG: class I SAM-dependent methyltransferase [Candidatus Methanoperedens sp.]|nr:class I SAM-dependent methyltransferase [Candidatus Methanoperedens sp.]